MRSLISGGILLVLVYCSVGDGPTGSYCGSIDTALGKATIRIAVASPYTADIDASWIPRGGQEKRGSVTDVKFEYDAPTGAVTVISLDKVQALINMIGAPLTADMLVHLEYKGNALYVVNLGNYRLDHCSHKVLL
ncbi:hypothetical protein FOL47_008037 [Perkinsus chesapeaki]|uniref:Uncharacterized protein n=1 Tax=Perkinsus chesapeaki TaxID=330153 RepID=A0A7J6N236_PERCH|nr:hypothetical protein FOL47_008037 [Perkinsus chesapeaki]